MEARAAVTIARAYAIFVWISALFAVFIGLAILTGGSLLATLNTATGDAFSALGRGAGIAVLVIGLIEALIGVGLWTLQPWSRIAIIIVSVLNLLSFPVGTIIGALGIYFFGFNDDMRRLFAREERRTVTPSAARRR